MIHSMDNLANAILRLKVQLNKTWTELAEYIGPNETTLREICRRKSKKAPERITPETAMALEDALDEPISRSLIYYLSERNRKPDPNAVNWNKLCGWPAP